MIAKRKVTAIFQVRMGSTRLPGKALVNIHGKPLLQHVVERVRRSKYIDEIVLATTTREDDQAIVQLAKEWTLKCYAGSEEDVLDRFYQAGRNFSAEIIVRITPDDPFKDPEIIDKALEILDSEKEAIEYVTNTLPPTYPIGLDIEVFFFDALRKAWQEARKPSEREHVTPYIWTHPEIFCLRNFSYVRDISHFRWTLDNEKDLLFTREIYKRIYETKPDFLMDDILEILSREPELAKINYCEEKYAGYLKSLEKDRQMEGRHG
jgi:spore coat polysaccharide biosynthesis protein SpsF